MNNIYQDIYKSARINTIQDFIDFAYGANGDILLSGYSAIAKADAPMLTTTTGAMNDIFGAQVWNQLNEKAPTFSALPKVPYTKNGFRVKTARGLTLGSSGVAENGAIPETKLPTYLELSLKLKHHVDSYSASLLAQLRAAGNDDLTIDQLRADIGEEHIKSINASLLKDADTLAGNNFESIDRVCSSQAEEAAFNTAGDCDIYGFDRSAAATLDAYVDHNSGTDRDLTKTMLNSAIRTIEQNSGERPNLVITGFDTAADIDALFESQARLPVERVTVGVNGVQTAAGNDVGLQVSMLYNIPVIVDAQVEKDTTSRIYFLNSNYLKFELALPTRNIETGLNDMVLLNAIGSKGVFITAGELKCTRFSAQGKIRDLK